MGFSNSCTSRRSFSVRHFPQPKFSARGSECCPRALAPPTWLRQPLLNNMARRRANSKLSAVCQEQPYLESRRKGGGCRYRILYPGSTALHAAFKELIGLTMPNLGPCPSFHLWAPTKKKMNSSASSGRWRPGWFRSYGTTIG